MNVHARNAKIIHDASFHERVDYVSIDNVVGYYIFDRRTMTIVKSAIRIYAPNALFGYDWKDTTP